MPSYLNAAFAVWVWLDQGLVYVADGSTTTDIRYSPQIEAARCFTSADAVLRFIASIPELLTKTQQGEAGIADLDCRFVGVMSR